MSTRGRGRKPVPKKTASALDIEGEKREAQNAIQKAIPSPPPPVAKPITIQREKISGVGETFLGRVSNYGEFANSPPVISPPPSIPPSGNVKNIVEYDTSSDEGEESDEDTEKSTKKKKSTKSGDAYKPTVGDVVKLGAIALIGSLEKREGSKFTGLRKRLRDDEMWNESFNMCLKKWISVPLTSLGPEAALVISTALVLSTVYAQNSLPYIYGDAEEISEEEEDTRTEISEILNKQ